MKQSHIAETNLIFRIQEKSGRKAVCQDDKDTKMETGSSNTVWSDNGTQHVFRCGIQASRSEYDGRR